MKFEANKKKDGWKLIIRQNEGWKFQWDTIILLLAIFNSITIPLTLSYDDIGETLSNN